MACFRLLHDDDDDDDRAGAERRAGVHGAETEREPGVIEI